MASVAASHEYANILPASTARRNVCSLSRKLFSAEFFSSITTAIHNTGIEITNRNSCMNKRLLDSKPIEKSEFFSAIMAVASSAVAERDVEAPINPNRAAAQMRNGTGTQTAIG